MKQSDAMTLDTGLKKMYLSSIKDCYSDEADLDWQESLSYELYLQELVVRECIKRRRKRIIRYLREFKFSLEKNLDLFDRSRLLSKINGLVTSLRDGFLLDRVENILAFGNPGVENPSTLSHRPGIDQSGETYFLYTLQYTCAGFTCCQAGAPGKYNCR